LSLGWLALLSGWLYPLLTAHYPGMNAGTSRYSYLGDSIGAIALGLIQHPQRILSHVDWAGAAVYLLLLALPLLPFWHQASLPVLLAGQPLIAVNLLSESGAQRSLVHHYSLPLAVTGVVAALDGLVTEVERRVPWRRIAWAAACWAALAKPWFFTGPYLGRLALVPESRSALELVRPGDAIATTSYLALHQRGGGWCFSRLLRIATWRRSNGGGASTCSSSIHRYRAGPPRASCSAACWSKPAAGAGAAEAGRRVCSCAAAWPEGPRRVGAQEPRLPAP